MSGRYADQRGRAPSRPDPSGGVDLRYRPGNRSADSPHLALHRTDSRLYFGCAETDQYAPREMIDKLRFELDTHGGNAEVEIYPGTHHGFAFPQRPAYDKPAAERHWERLFALFRAALT